MACYMCPGGYWVCDATEEMASEGLCDDEAQASWNYKWTQTIPVGTFHVWCRTGCDAKLAKTQPMGPPEWYDAGEIDFHEEGDYSLWCRPGSGGDKCEVKVQKV